MESFKEGLNLGLDHSRHFFVADQVNVLFLIMIGHFNVLSAGLQFLNLYFSKIIELVAMI